MKNTLNMADITVVARFLSPLWGGYQSCGEATQPPVGLPNLWRDYLWRGYLVARLPVTLMTTKNGASSHL